MSSGHVNAHRMINLVTLDLYRELVEARGLNRHGLMLVRDKMLRPEAAGLIPSPDIELLALDVNELLAACFDAPPDELPDRAPLDPDDFADPGSDHTTPEDSEG